MVRKSKTSTVRKRQHYPADYIAAVVAMVEKGETVAAVSKRLNLHQSTLGEWCRKTKNNVPTRYSKPQEKPFSFQDAKDEPIYAEEGTVAVPMIPAARRGFGPYTARNKNSTVLIKNPATFNLIRSTTPPTAFIEVPEDLYAIPLPSDVVKVSFIYLDADNAYLMPYLGNKRGEDFLRIDRHHFPTNFKAGIDQLCVFVYRVSEQHVTLKAAVAELNSIRPPKPSHGVILENISRRLDGVEQVLASLSSTAVSKSINSAFNG